MIKNIAITGGVHGNELTGAYLIKKFQKRPIKTKNINIDYILANPKAFKECKRYIDYDLNRSFSINALKEDSHFYEFERAKVIKERLKNCDFLLDLHSTTSNMKMSVVLSKDDEISNLIAKEIKNLHEDVYILRWFSNSEGDFINSIVPHSITLEVGPICQGVLDADIFFKTEKIVKSVIEMLDNNSFKKELNKTEVYDIVDIVDFPRENGEISAMIHPSLIGKDYSLLKKGDPIFVDFNGKEIFYENEPMYAVFINEAAYYEKKMAFCLCEKRYI
ncbi:aspartoacylase [Nitrosophilus kaiyonis]|uniref:aspartoacylase n=1 Tax=Nitrosophilus kaiyonis TaxID=2930200 RepID=UPI00249030EC|nr:aspartoacylase [Nitrosophilus kaiyonis]